MEAPELTRCIYCDGEFTPNKPYLEVRITKLDTKEEATGHVHFDCLDTITKAFPEIKLDWGTNAKDS